MISKNVAFLPGAKPIDEQRELSIEEKLQLTVNNTGNYFFEQSVVKHLAGVDVIERWDSAAKGYDTLVLSMANFISPSVDFSYPADLIERSELERVIMIGAGAQAHDFGESIKIKQGTERFIKILSERSVSIGVRGQFTAELLDRMGIRNVEVIGCPSLFWRMDRNYHIHQPVIPDQPKIAIHATPSGHYRDKVASLFSFGGKYGSAYIAQNEIDLIRLATPGYGRSERCDFLFKYYNDGQLSPQELESWFANNTKCFFGLDEWIAFLGDYDFVVGSRFHGNMAAIQAGTPALTLVFDTRTRELCEFLNLPYIFLQDFPDKPTPDQIYAMTDYSLFNSTFKKKYDNYVGFLESNGLAHNLISHEPGWGYSRNINGRELNQYDTVKTLSTWVLSCDISGESIPPESILREICNRMRDERPAASRLLAEKRKLEEIGGEGAIIERLREVESAKAKMLSALDSCGQQLNLLRNTLQTVPQKET